MSRSRVSISNCPDRKTIAPSPRSCAGSPKRYGFSAAFAPPVCFISALALTWVIGGVGAAANSGGCTSTVPGVDLTCTGTVVNPAAFTATSDFNVNIGTTTPDDPATITRTSDNAGLKINAGDHGGVIDMSTGSSMKTDVGDSANRNGLVLASGAAATDKTYTIDLDGTIIPQPSTAMLSGWRERAFRS